MNKKDQKIIIDAERDGIPIFVITAKDKNAVTTLQYYKSVCSYKGCEEHHIAGIKERISEFSQWQSSNQDKVKIPD